MSHLFYTQVVYADGYSTKEVRELKPWVLSLRRLYRNWRFHKLVGHPLSDVAYWLTFPFVGDRFRDWVHDLTLPPEATKKTEMHRKVEG